MNGSNVLKGLRLSIEESMYAEDPCRWMEGIVRETPDPWQRTFLESKRSEILLNCCRQSGKTEIAAIKAAHNARYNKNSLTVVLSATLNQAGILQRRVTLFLGMANDAWQKGKTYDVKEYNRFTNEFKIIRRNVLSLELANNSRIVSIPASPEAVRGYTPNLIIVDEGAFIEDEVFLAVMPMRGVTKAPIILMSTPNAKHGFFYEEWTSDDPVWLKIKISADDCDRLTDEFLEREKIRYARYAKGVFEREFYNKFLDIQGAVFSQEMIDNLFKPRESDKEVVEMHKSDKNLITPGGLYGWR